MEDEGFITPDAGRAAARAKPGEAGARERDDRRLVRRLGAGRADRRIWASPSATSSSTPRSTRGCSRRPSGARADRSAEVRSARPASTRRRSWSSTPAARCAPWSAAATIATSPFNRAVAARRQPGSAFKPFVYLAALEAGWRPGNTIDDRRRCGIGDWQPAQLRRQVPRQRSPLAEAFAHSVNTAAVRLAQTRRAGAGGGDGAPARRRLAAAAGALDRAGHLGGEPARAHRRLPAVRHRRRPPAAVRGDRGRGRRRRRRSTGTCRPRCG